MGGSHGFTPREGRPFLGQPRQPQLSAGKDGTIDPNKACRYCKDTGHKLENCVHLQRKMISKLIIRQDRSQTKSSFSWGLQGGAKVDPTIPISPTSQYDELLSTQASNAVSMETEQRIMKRAVSTCPTVNLNVQGKEVPSLMDSGSMVTLVQEGYFEKNILPVLKTLPGELSKVHSLFKFLAANNGVMPVSRYFEADINLLGFRFQR